ncbi:MAG: DUF4340 domain-containing protein [Methylacidiphilales bacterium]|nr:DUF4340 domain-containing protein [Candidatus Methylacidiphilales bacterium]MDW8348815.1 DUF4340 domain-containing protein [Verrucomicrobiae bacterium]
MQPYKSIIIYATLVTTLGIYIFFVAKNQKSTTETIQAENNLFIDVPFSKVIEAKLIAPTGTFSFTKQNDKWRITAPINTPADSPTIDMILSEIEFSQSKRTIPFEQINNPQETLAQWGLNPPTFTFEFKTQQDNNKPPITYTLQLGRKTAFSETYYARIGTDPKAPVVLVPSTLHAALNRKLDDLRDRTIFYDLDDPQSVETISFQAESLHAPPIPQEFLLKLKDKKWSFERPFTARASTEKVNEFLNFITSLNSVQFITDSQEELNKFGLDTPTYQINLTTAKESSSHTLLIGNPITEQSEFYYAKRLKDPAVFSINREDVNKLINFIKSLRDLTIATFSSDHVTQLTIQKNRNTITFIRQQSKWLFANAADTLADHVKISNLLQRLQKTPANRVVKDAATDLKPYGLDKPSTRITLKLEIPAPPNPTATTKDTPPPAPTTQTIEILVGKIDKNEVHLSNNFENTIYAFPTNILDDLNSLDPSSWRSKILFNLESSQIQTLKLTPKNQPPYTISRQDAQSFTTTLENTKLDPFKTETLFVRAASLQAVNWLNLPQRTFQTPHATIQITTQNNTTYTLTVGAPLANGNFPVLLTPQNIQAEILAQDILSLLSVPIETPEKKTSVTTPPVEAPLPPPTSPQ